MTEIFSEVIYQRCLVIELEQAGLSFVREQEQTSITTISEWGHEPILLSRIRSS
jgi:hypothetical protein